jgi:4-amino-4-deoxy-L-arabinose transferase-like glycosyltransferase
MLALFWTALGLYLATGDRRQETGDNAASDRLSPVSRSVVLPLAAVCFALAFFTKQTAVAAPLAVGLALLVADVRAPRP